jgi:hypothetical protein
LPRVSWICSSGFQDGCVWLKGKALDNRSSNSQQVRGGFVGLEAAFLGLCYAFYLTQKI